MANSSSRFLLATAFLCHLIGTSGCKGSQTFNEFLKLSADVEAATAVGTPIESVRSFLGERKIRYGERLGSVLRASDLGSEPAPLKGTERRIGFCILEAKSESMVRAGHCDSVDFGLEETVIGVQKRVSNLST